MTAKNQSDEKTPLPKWMLFKFDERLDLYGRRNLVCIVRSYAISDVNLKARPSTVYAENRSETTAQEIAQQIRSEEEIILDERGYLTGNIVRANHGLGTEDCVLISASEYRDLKSDAENYRVIRERLSDEYIAELVKKIAKDT